MTGRPGPQDAPILDLDGIHHAYRTGDRDVTVLDGIDLQVRAGEIVGISGPSGTGKSTLLRIAAGLEAPLAGTVRYGPHPLWSGRARRAVYPRPGYAMPVFQDPYASLDPRWPIWRILAEPIGRFDRRTASIAAAAALAQVGLQRLDLDARPRELSGGECQRIAVLRALAARPALLVADEPTARQDLVTAAAVAQLFRQVADQGTAILVVSHNTAWLDSIADRSHRLTDGRLITGFGSGHEDDPAACVDSVRPCLFNLRKGHGAR